jgi:hypothetical protein
MFNSAASTGYAARPVLLFYGLSQAGRAISAASTAVGNDAYRLSGHGIEMPDLTQRPFLHRLRLVNKGTGSFTQLARLLACGSLPCGEFFGQLWAMLPDLRDCPLDADRIQYNPPLRCFEEYELNGFEGKRELTESIRLLWCERPPDKEEVVNFLGAYPTLPSGNIRAITAERVNDGPGDLQVRDASLMGNWGYLVWVKMVLNMDVDPPGQQYSGPNDLWVFPAVGGSSRPMHPLLVWWAVLYALSMLCRYEPASWVSHLGVDTSPNAVALETALDRALDTCPRLILQTINLVSAGQVD